MQIGNSNFPATFKNSLYRLAGRISRNFIRYTALPSKLKCARLNELKQSFGLFWDA